MTPTAEESLTRLLQATLRATTPVESISYAATGSAGGGAGAWAGDGART
jgi:hypothetical protein